MRLKPLIIYHHPCADGAGAAFAAWCRFGEEAEYLPASYGDPIPADDQVRDRDVFILDFSYSRADLERLHAFSRTLCVVDHHKTAQTILGDLPYAKFNMTHSGAVLAWQHFHGDMPVPEILLYIEDRDLWSWKLQNSKEISAALEARNIWKDFRNLVGVAEWFHFYRAGFLGRWWWRWQQRGKLRALAAEGAALLRQQQNHVDTIVFNAELTRGLAGDSVHYVVNSCLLQSEVGNALAEKAARAPEAGCAPMAAIWYRDGRGRFKVSLRSVGEYDVSVIANRFGGGGHKNAASFYCEKLPWV